MQRSRIGGGALVALLFASCSNGDPSSASDLGPSSGVDGDANRDAATPNGTTDGATAAQPGVGLFPSSSIFYQDITSAPIDSAWPTIRAAVDALGGWGTSTHKIQINFEFHVLAADATVVPRAFTPTSAFFYEGECDTAPIPLPPGGAVEAQMNYACNTAANDCHVTVVQGTRLYEAWKVNVTGGTANGSPFNSGCLAVWDLTKDYWQPVGAGAVYARGDHCGSADAGGFPISALLFSADEIAAGEIKHAIRFIMPNDRIRSDVYVHPATHAAGSGAMDVLPYGARLRLKAGTDISGLRPWAQVVAKAMKKYGMFLSDGGNQALTAQSDKFTTAKWGTNLTQNDLGALSFDDFEMVDGGTRIPRSGNCPHTVITQ